MSVSIYAVHENRQKGFDLKAALLSEQKGPRWELEARFKNTTETCTTIDSSVDQTQKFPTPNNLLFKLFEIIRFDLFFFHTASQQGAVFCPQTQIILVCLEKQKTEF